ncbi:unnamed protein product [Mytilus coruscus]|uniref:Uncharacterized protein n=1 Tax=Mytilus coruscus TaxID=42192 RepID=A0A6J8EXA2_MYTCO|nr:unnamed protein product [Mytilus coruscus]
MEKLWSVLPPKCCFVQTGSSSSSGNTSVQCMRTRAHHTTFRNVNSLTASPTYWHCRNGIKFNFHDDIEADAISYRDQETPLVTTRPIPYLPRVTDSPEDCRLQEILHNETRPPPWCCQNKDKTTPNSERALSGTAKTYRNPDTSEVATNDVPLPPWCCQNREGTTSTLSALTVEATRYRYDDCYTVKSLYLQSNTATTCSSADTFTLNARMENLETALNLLQNNYKRMEQAMNQQVEKVVEIIANDINKEDVIRMFLDYNEKDFTKIRNKRLKDAVQFMTNSSKTIRNALMHQTSAIKKLSDAYQRTKTPHMDKHELDSHVCQWLGIEGRRPVITETPQTVTTNINILEDDNDDMNIAAPTPCLNGTRQVIHFNTGSKGIDKQEYLTTGDRNNNNYIHSNNQRTHASSNRSHTDEQQKLKTDKLKTDEQYELKTDEQHQQNTDEQHQLKTDEQHQLKMDKLHKLKTDEQQTIKTDEQQELKNDEQHDLKTDGNYKLKTIEEHEQKKDEQHE